MSLFHTGTEDNTKTVEELVVDHLQDATEMQEKTRTAAPQRTNLCRHPNPRTPQRPRGSFFVAQTLGVSSKTSADTANYGPGCQWLGASQEFPDCFFGEGQELSFSLCLPGEGCALGLKS